MSIPNLTIAKCCFGKSYCFFFSELWKMNDQWLNNRFCTTKRSGICNLLNP